MSTDASLTLQAGPPPPPYSPDEYPEHPPRLPDNLNLSQLAEQTLHQINEVNNSHFFSPISLRMLMTPLFYNSYIVFKHIFASFKNGCLKYRQLAVDTL